MTLLCDQSLKIQPLLLLLLLLLQATVFCGADDTQATAVRRQSKQQFGNDLLAENETLTCHQCRASYLPGVSLFKCLAIAGRATCAVPRSTGKCASQTQVQYSHKVGANVHTVLRICYNTAEDTNTGNKSSWLDHSDGCRFVTNPVNYTAEYCFCSEDLCNTATDGPQAKTASRLATLTTIAVCAIRSLV